MSWFTDLTTNLTSKAESLLVKLDQEAAQALQDPQVILRKANRIIHQSSRNTSESNLNHNTNESHQNKPSLNEPVVEVRVNNNSNNVATEIPYANGQITNSEITHTSKAALPSYSSLTDNLAHTGRPESHEIYRNEAKNLSNQYATNNIDGPTKTFEISDSKMRHGKKFKFLANGKKSRYQNGYQNRPSIENVTIKSVDHQTDRHDAESPIDSLDADTIRASINQALNEYSMSCDNSVNTRQSTNSTACSSHFDSQPLLMSHMTATGSKVGGQSSNYAHSSTSYCIDVDDDISNASAHSEAVNRLLMSTALRRKSTLMHQVINRLANPDIQARALISERTRAKLRRSRRRLMTYARRLNYYWRAYPATKYWMLCCIVVMQLLAIYVLFFYRSSSSATYLSSQIQQQEAGNNVRVDNKHAET